MVEQTTEGADDDRHSWRQRADRSTNLGRVEVNGRALDRDGPIAHGTIPFHRVTTFAVFRSVLCPQSRSNPGGTIIRFRDKLEERRTSSSSTTKRTIATGRNRPRPTMRI